MIKKTIDSSITSACCTLVHIIVRRIHIENIYIVVEYQTYFVQGLKTGEQCEVYQAFVICFDLENYV